MRSINKNIKINRKFIINLILIIIILVCVFKLASRYLDYYKEKKKYSTVQILKPIIKENINVDNNENTNEEKLKNINSDYRMWISIPNTDINYPVVQGKDNDFYLHNNFNKEKSDSGAIFVDYNNNIDLDKNIIIYGHDMKDGSMFNKINNFKKQEAFNNGTIKIIKDNKEYTYEVFSVFVVKENYDGIKLKFNTNEDYVKYIDELKQKSMYNKNISEKNNILTLFTCSYEFSGARTIVCAVMK